MARYGSPSQVESPLALVGAPIWALPVAPPDDEEEAWAGVHGCCDALRPGAAARAAEAPEFPDPESWGYGYEAS